MKPLSIRMIMNATEARYAQNLEMMKKSENNPLKDWRFEAIRLKIGEQIDKKGKRKSIYYKPDFFLVYDDRFEIHEIKGIWREAAKVRIRAAAMLYPWFRFKAVYYSKKTGFVYEIF